MKRTFCILGLMLCSMAAFSQFDGPAGTQGSRAVGISDSRIVSWAFGVQVNKGFVSPESDTKVSYGTPDLAQGTPDSTTTTAVSLGYFGNALISFDRPIIDGEGADFAVYENGFDSTFLELAFVEVSSDGINFFRFPATSLSSGTSDIKAQHYNNLAGKYAVGYGTPFDLSDIEDNDLLDKNNVRFVRLVDVNEGIDTDSHGNVVYDSPGAGSYSAGFDLTGIAVLNAARPYAVSSCENMLSTTDSHELIEQQTGTLGEDGNYHQDYQDGDMVFEALGEYMAEYDYFMPMGFGPSNHTTASGYYSAVSLRGLEGAGATYMVGYYSDFGTAQHNIIRKADNTSFIPNGIYVAPSTALYNHLAGETFPQDGYHSIVATGYDEAGNTTGSSTAYFIDKQTGTCPEAVQDWIFLDLAPLGECNKIVFTLTSNDLAYGYLNPPSYFCVDGLTCQTAETQFDAPVLAEELQAEVYPNPASNRIFVKTSSSRSQVSIFDLQSREVFRQTIGSSAELNLSLPAGVYVIRLTSGTNTTSKKLIIK